MHQVARQASDDNQLLFLPGVFNETLGLLFDAHQYFQERGVEEQTKIAPENQTLFANEMSRVTLRLTSVMAWLMVRRAVYCGRIEEELAADSYRLDARDVCLEEAIGITRALPSYLVYLLDRSLSLYERVMRLDDQAYGTRH
jgi:regulator of CtrA degradation